LQRGWWFKDNVAIERQATYSFEIDNNDQQILVQLMLFAVSSQAFSSCYLLFKVYS
jgi:hypothetical protein